MTDTPADEANPEEDKPFQEYVARCSDAFQKLFDAAKAREEVQFAMALNPEMRGMQGAGWSTAAESMTALNEYIKLINSIPKDNMRTRICLSLYSHLSEASGFYEVPKNMLRIASGESYNFWPFQNLVSGHAESGAIIAPNANKVMKDLIGHAAELKMTELQNVILETFDPDIRNGYAHADYIIWDDGIRLRKRNGGQPRVVSFEEFIAKLNKAVAFFETLKDKIGESMRSYSTPRRVVGKMNNNKGEPSMPTVISYDEKTGAFSITSGLGL